MSSIFSFLSDDEWLTIFNRVYLWATGIAVLSGAIALFATRGIHIYSDRVSVAQRKQIVEAQTQAEEAKKQAAIANERAQALEGQNIKLRTDLENATAESHAKQTELAYEQQKLAQEQQKTAEAQREAAQAQLALKKHLEEVAERQRPCHLTAQQRARFLELLNDKPQGSVEIRCSVGDPEAYNFALEIADALKAAGWQAEVNNRVIIVPTPVGLKLWVRAAQTAPIHAIALLNILDAIDFPPIAEQNLELPEGTTVLIVGAKP